MEYVHELNANEEINEDNKLFHNFQEMDYYMLLQSRVGCGVSLDYYSYGIYGNITQTPQEGEELYFKLNNMQLKSSIKSIKQTEVSEWQNFSLTEHVAGCSPDLEFCITNQAFYISSTGDYMERLYTGDTLLSENEEKLYYGTRIAKYTFCEEPETGHIVIIDENRRKRIEDLVNSTWFCEERDYSIFYSKSRFCLSKDGMMLALVKPDNKRIGIYETEGCTELFEFEFEQLDEDWPIEVFEIQGNMQEGWIIFSNGDKTYKALYPLNELVFLGEFMFNVSMSPDGKYCAYYTGSDLLYSSWEILYMDNWDKFADMLERWNKVPSGWYIKELDSGLTAYISVKSMADNGQPPWEGKCMWIQKDKLFEVLKL